MTNTRVAPGVELGETEFDRLVADARARYGAAQWDALVAQAEALMATPRYLTAA